MSSNDYLGHETIHLRAQKISRRGKARFRLSDGFEGFVEEVTIHHLETQGWQCLWSENQFWWTVMALLFWDVLFARLEGVWNAEFGEFPSRLQDMPQDLFRPEFYPRRQVIIERRLEELKTVDITADLTKLYSLHYEKPCRPIEDWHKFSLTDLLNVAQVIPREVLLAVVHRLLGNFNENRRGLPDLFLWSTDSVAFAEVKGPGDNLSPNQLAWFQFLKTLKVMCLLVKVEAVVDESSISSGIEKKIEGGAIDRLQQAKANFPYPAGFREAAIALRTLIRQRRKEKRDYEDLLRELYKVCAQENLLLGDLYVEDIVGPGFNVAESIPRSAWEALDMPYEEIGYNEIPLLNKTDKKWFVDAWGMPKQHRSSQTFHSNFWRTAVLKYKAKEREEDRINQEEWQRILKPNSRSSVTAVDQSGGKGCGVVLITIILLLLGALLVVL